jgi:parvulin-like peptidyl-prolyl isomerase
MDRRIFEALLRKNVSLDRDAVTPSAVRAYYDDHLDAFRVPARVTFRHLLIRPNETPGKKEARAWAKELRARLLAGADFSELAREHSHGPRAAQGGHWQEVDPSTWRSELTGCLIELPVGRVSDIIESEIGLHIVQVLAREGSRIRSFNEVQVGIEDHLYWRLADDAIGSWLAEIAREAYVWSLLDLPGATLYGE